MATRLNAKVRYQLTREIEVLSKSPRLLQVTSSEFAEEMTRELGSVITRRHIESAIEGLDMRVSDVFKNGSGGSGRSVYADLYKLEKRVEALEQLMK